MPEDFHLSPNFSFFELTNTSKTELLEKNRQEALAHTVTLKTLAEGLLEPVRRHFGSPVIVSSGFRCLELNTAIGGSPTSQHCNGEAADITVLNVSHDDVFFWLWRQSNLPFGQLIDETRGHKRWIHISLGEPYRPADKCREVWTNKNGNMERIA